MKKNFILGSLIRAKSMMSLAVLLLGCLFFAQDLSAQTMPQNVNTVINGSALVDVPEAKVILADLAQAQWSAIQSTDPTTSAKARLTGEFHRTAYTFLVNRDSVEDALDHAYTETEEAMRQRGVTIDLDGLLADAKVALKK